MSVYAFLFDFLLILEFFCDFNIKTFLIFPEKALIDVLNGFHENLNLRVSILKLRGYLYSWLLTWINNSKLRISNLYQLCHFSRKKLCRKFQIYSAIRRQSLLLVIKGSNRHSGRDEALSNWFLLQWQCQLLLCAHYLRLLLFMLVTQRSL